MENAIGYIMVFQVIFMILYCIPIVMLQNAFQTKARIRFANFLMIAIMITYIIACSIVIEMNIGDNMDRTVGMTLAILFAPYFWIGSITIFNKIFANRRINKKTKPKGDILYYRDDLSEFSPAIISFVKNFRVDIKSSISSTLLKLKLEGYIKVKDDVLVRTEKDVGGLLRSDILLLETLRTGEFKKKEYINTIKEEVYEQKLLKKYNASLGKKALKVMGLFIVHAILLLVAGVGIFLVGEEINKAVLGSLEGYITDIGFFFAMLAMLLYLLVIFSIIITRIRCFKSDYIRSYKGNEAVTKAYGLYNYLKDYSLIKERTSEELILWEYYLVYAVSLGINDKVEDEFIMKFVDKIKEK